MLAAAIGVLAAGCGGGARSPRQRLAGYVSAVDGVELQLRKPLSAVTQTGNRFSAVVASASKDDTSVQLSEQRALLLAAQRVGVLRGQLARISTPTEAAHLRALLLELVDAQLALTREVAQMVVFIPRYGTDLAAVQPAIHRLERALQARTGSLAAKAAAQRPAALDAFAGTLESVLARLRGLRPPHVSRPGLRAQSTALAGMSRSARLLAGALRDGDVARAQAALAELERAARSDQTIVAQRAQIAAVRSYDHQVQRLEALVGAIEAERSRMAATVH